MSPTWQPSTPSGRRGIFFDRDGILNRVVMRGSIVGSPRDLHEFQPFPATKDILRAASTKGIVTIVTNQPDVSSGQLDIHELEKMHTKLQSLGPYITLILWEGSNLPNHPRRKPSPTMLFEAARVLSLDLSNSWMIGDSSKDLHAGQSAGCKTVLLQTNYNQDIHGSGDINLDNHQELLLWLENIS